MQAWTDCVIIQKIFANINENTLEQDAFTISKLEMSKSLIGICRFLNILEKYIRNRFNKIHIYALLIKELDSLASEENCLDDLVTLCLRQYKDHPSLLRIIYKLLDFGCIQEEEIVAEFSGKIDNLCTYSFLPIILKHDIELYRKVFLNSHFVIRKERLMELESNFDLYKEYLYYNCEPDSPMRYIMDDDVDSLSNYFAKNSNCINLVNNIELSVKMGSANCFKYLYMMDQQSACFIDQLQIIKGGNLEILHIFQRELNINFFNVINLFHALDKFQNHIFEWILTNSNLTQKEQIDIVNMAARLGNIEAIIILYNFTGFLPTEFNGLDDNQEILLFHMQQSNESNDTNKSYKEKFEKYFQTILEEL